MTGLPRQKQNPAYRTLRLHKDMMKTGLSTAISLATMLLIAAAIALALYAARLYTRLPAEPEPAAVPTPRALDTEVISVPEEAWSMIRGLGRPQAVDGPLAQRFRLAGTFFLYGESGTEEETQERRRAIIDDLSAKSQLLVQENQELDGYLVTRIEQDRVRLQRDGTEYELTLSFSAVSSTAGGEKTDGSSAENVSMEDMPALETSRFGKRVGENRWVIKREELLRYYAELLDNPERIAEVYASLKPDYNNNEIEGYYLDSEGEQDFFRAIGLQEHDVIRRVNSMRMVSQRRAEYFITEFMKNRVSALVFDVERDGVEQKLIYLIR